MLFEDEKDKNEGIKIRCTLIMNKRGRKIRVLSHHQYITNETCSILVQELHSFKTSNKRATHS